MCWFRAEALLLVVFLHAGGGRVGWLGDNEKKGGWEWRGEKGLAGAT